MRKKINIAAIGVSLAVAFSVGSVTQADARSKARVKPVTVKNACVYSTLLCPAVVMDTTGKRYDISGLKRPNANPVNVFGVPRADGTFCGTRLSPGVVRPAKGGACIFPLRLF